MAKTVISVEHLTKRYELGVIGRTTLRRDFERWWARARGRPDPTIRIGKEAQAARYGETILALDDVSFTVREGEALGIIGRNGAGKSTLLKILSRVTAPTEGVIKVKGRIGSLLEVGTGFHPELTGRENIYLNGAILGMTRAEIDRKFDEIVAFSGVEQFIDTPVKRYSSGMHVRLGFAVAAHLDPEILIVDEVLAVGDAEFQKKCLGKMGEVADEGRTVLFVSHNIQAVRDLCDNGILISDGKIADNDDINQVVNCYLRENTASLSPRIKLPDQPSLNLMGENLGRGLQLLISSINGGEPRSEFKINERFRIRLEFEVYKPLIHCIVAIGLITLQGVSIVTYWTKPKKIYPGKYYADFFCDLSLKACDLKINVGLSEYEKSFYYVENQGRISIIELSGSGKPFRTKGGGLLLGNSTSEIVSIDKNNYK